MPHFSPEVGKVGQRLGRLEAAPMTDVPNLPNLPNLSLARVRAYGCAPAHIRARARNSFYVRKVRKVRKIPCFCGFQPSQPAPNLGEVGKV